MSKKRYQQQPRLRITRKRLLAYGIIAAVTGIIGYVGYSSMIPVNGTVPVFGMPANHFIKATHSSGSGYHWLSMSSGKVKGMRSAGGNIMNPEYIFNKGELESFHVVNEDYTTKSQHNFNIDELNIHTRDLGFYESQTVTFVADKTGTFEYYCTIHPGMEGKVTIE